MTNTTNSKRVEVVISLLVPVDFPTEDLCDAVADTASALREAAWVDQPDDEWPAGEPLWSVEEVDE